MALTFQNTLKPTIALLLAGAMLAGCMIPPSGSRRVDPDAEFAKLDSPNVPTIEGTLEKSAQNALEAGDSARAEQFYRQLLDQDQTNPRYLLGLGESLRRKGDNDTALKVYTDVLSLEPGNVEAMEGKGLSLMAMGEFVESGKLFSDIMKQDRKRWRTLNALGILFALKNLNDEAIAYYTEALKFKPEHPAILNNVGLTYATNKQFDQAAMVLQRGASRLPNDSAQRRNIELNLALVYGISGNFEKARETASRHLSGPALDNNLGYYAYLADNEELAKSYLNMALSHSPTHYQRAWENLGTLIEQSKPGHSAPNSKSFKVN